VENIATLSGHEIPEGHLTFSVYESKTKDELSAQITYFPFGNKDVLYGQLGDILLIIEAMSKKCQAYCLDDVKTKSPSFGYKAS
jgi:hypothetical protein